MCGWIVPEADEMLGTETLDEVHGIDESFASSRLANSDKVNRCGHMSIGNACDLFVQSHFDGKVCKP